MAVKVAGFHRYSGLFRPKYSDIDGKERELGEKRELG